MTAIGIENISVFGLPPVEFVHLAADLGCQHISTGLTSFDFGIAGYPPFSLREDAALRRDMQAAMRERGISISLGEGCTIRPGSQASAFAADLDLFAELGTLRINSVSMDPDFARTCDQLGILAEMVIARGMRATIEPSPPLTIRDLPTAIEALKQIGNPQLRLLIDTMHMVRSGATPADLAALDPDLIDYVQVADAPKAPEIANYMEEAMFERMVPGEGGLGLADVLAVLPADRVYALEVPLRRAALSGETPHARLGRCVTALRGLLTKAHGHD
jgi:sugar phosphate isomerase/epimerase